MRKFKFLFVLLVLFIGILKVSAFDNTVKIYDYAQILTNNQEQRLKKLVDSYIRKYNIDMAIVTVKHHEASSTQNYAMNFYNYNNFGTNDTKDGIILVIDFMNDNTNFYIEAFGNSKMIYETYRINKMIKNISNIKNDNYYKAIEKFIGDSDDYANKGAIFNSVRHELQNNTFITTKNIWVVIISIIISSIVPSIVILIYVFKNKMVKKSYLATHYLKKDSVVISVKKDTFYTTHTKKERIKNDS